MRPGQWRRKTPLVLLHDVRADVSRGPAIGMRRTLRDFGATPPQGELLREPRLDLEDPARCIVAACTLVTDHWTSTLHAHEPDESTATRPSLDRAAGQVAPHAADAARDAAFEREVLACLPDVTRYARSLTHDEAAADDLVQDTFLLAYRGYHTFRIGEDVRRWPLTICRRAFLRDRVRSTRVVTTDEGSDSELDTLAAVSGHAEARRAGEDMLFERFDLAPAIAHAIAALPEAFRRAVVLVDVEGAGYEEAAEIEAVPVGTIRSRRFRGRRRLQEQLLDFARDAGYQAAMAPPAATIAAPAVIRPRRAPRHATGAHTNAPEHTT